jgi:hypothetical protein
MLPNPIVINLLDTVIKNEVFSSNYVQKSRMLLNFTKRFAIYGELPYTQTQAQKCLEFAKHSKVSKKTLRGFSLEYTFKEPI